MAPKSKKKKSKKKVKDPEQEALEIKRQELIKQAQDLTNEIANEEKTKKEFAGRLAQIKINWSMEKKKIIWRRYSTWSRNCYACKTKIELYYD